jgi:hypothetical protein
MRRTPRTKLTTRTTLSLLATFALATGCAGSPAMRAAESGDRAQLRAHLLEKEKAGTMSNGEAESLARAVARHELEQARGLPGLDRVRDLEACGGELDGAFAGRMDPHDAVGAAAAMVRVEDGSLGESSARGYQGDPDDGWRAVGARGLVRKKDSDDRQRAMKDGSALVRRAAMRAAARAESETDEDALFEAARVDPDPYVRALAVRAMGTLPKPHGEEGALVLVRRVNRLRDLWTAGDEPLREDVGVAYTMPGIYGAEAEKALAVVLAEADGPGAIAAAGAVLRAEDRTSKALASSAEALLLRTLASGSKASIRDRLHAVAIAPLDRDATAKALRALQTDDDQRVRVAALARLTAADGASPERLKALRDLDKVDQPSVSSRARAALARAGDRSVQGDAERDLGNHEGRLRLAALDDLAALGLAGRGAALLADDDAEVRTRAACTVLRTAH